MSQDVDFQPLGDAVDPAGSPVDVITDLRRLAGVPVDLSVEIGRTHMSVGETLELREGSVVTLDRMAGEPVDLLVNGKPIARGEIVVIDEQFGLRLTEVLAAPVVGDAGSRGVDPEPAGTAVPVADR
jgi:flagellar motor switch protein FliN